MSYDLSAPEAGASSVAPPPAPAGFTSTPRHRFQFMGNGSEYFGIWIANLLLSIITLGIYSAWAKVRNNRYIYGNTALGGDRFEYLATPMQILIGRIIAVIALALYSYLANISIYAPLVMLFLVSSIVPVLVVRNLRFDARMTRFRHVCFDFQGSYVGAFRVVYLNNIIAGLMIAIPYFTFSVLFSFLINDSAGSLIGVLAGIAGAICAYGWTRKRFHHYLINGYRYGDKAFKGEVKEKQFIKIGLYSSLLTAALLAVSVAILFLAASAILGDFSALWSLDADGWTYIYMLLLVPCYILYMLIFVVMKSYMHVMTRNYVMSQMTVDNLSLESQIPVGKYIATVGMNLLIMIFTCGLAYPIAQVRLLKLSLGNTLVNGDLDNLVVRGAADHEGAAIADEMSNAFNIDLGVI
ncbi:YjgN family protein [Pokkaliibacter sp. CJK22405]|uniref:YjgN family protein n=1 Tax=Pokkaliibacter sp. CJK22405 TaxID=3384615 RepID=UPI0039847CAA